MLFSQPPLSAVAGYWTLSEFGDLGKFLIEKVTPIGLKFFGMLVDLDGLQLGIDRLGSIGAGSRSGSAGSRSGSDWIGRCQYFTMG